MSQVKKSNRNTVYQTANNGQKGEENVAGTTLLEPGAKSPRWLNGIELRVGVLGLQR